MVRINAEWDCLKKVAVHTPGMEMYFGLLDPYSSLYERAFSQSEALREHELLIYTLKHEFKVDVLTLRDTIVSQADKYDDIRDKLLELAYNNISFTGTKQDVKQAREEMNKNKDYLDSDYFFNTVLLNPCINIESGEGVRMVQLKVTEREPLSNLYFMRDQHLVTDKGIIISNMSKPQRQRETLITRFFWQMLKQPIIHEIEAPGTLEGGDFMPLGDFALMGVGDRTNQQGINQLLDYGLDYDEVGVVHQPNHPLIPGDDTDPMVNMHLDTYFNVISKELAVGCELLLENANVEIYNKCNDEYIKTGDEMSLHEYLSSKGFEIINITTLEQMAYASNFLCIENGRILTVEVDRVIKNVLEKLRVKAIAEPYRYKKLFIQAKKDYTELRLNGQFFPHKKEVYQHDVDAVSLNLVNLTGGYGGAHCMSCALKRV